MDLVKYNKSGRLPQIIVIYGLMAIQVVALAEFGRIPWPGRTQQNLAEAADCHRL